VNVILWLSTYLIVDETYPTFARQYISFDPDRGGEVKRYGPINPSQSSFQPRFSAKTKKLQILPPFRLFRKQSFDHWNDEKSPY
jgi:hypothetical protein